jgi:hypothetical protein
MFKKKTYFVLVLSALLLVTFATANLFESSIPEDNSISNSITGGPWKITKNGTEKNMDVTYNIINDTATEFCFSVPDKTKYITDLSLKTRSISEVPITKLKGEFEFSKTKLDFSKVIGNEKNCFNVNYEDMGNVSFKVGWETITISAAIMDGFDNINSDNALIWTNESNGYMLASALSPNNLVVFTTKDSGTTWTHTLNISTVNGIIAFSTWYDQWTSDDFGDLIHIVYVDLTNDDLFYKSLNVTNDTLSGEVTLVDHNAVSNTAISITKARDGTLYAGGYLGTSFLDTLRSLDNGASWTSIANVFESDYNDNVILIPGNEENISDIWALYWDGNANEISLKSYNSTSDSWSETSITTGAIDSPSSFFHDWHAIHRQSDNHTVLAFWNERDAATADLEVWEINSSTAITPLSNITNNFDDIINVALMINQQNDDLYAVTIGKNDSTQGVGNNVLPYYKKSIDNGITWGDEVELDSGADDLSGSWAGVSVGNKGGRFQPVWFNDDLNDLLTNNTNGVEISKYIPGSDTCTCPSINEDWEIDHADSCEITDNCDLGTGQLTFTGSGSTYCNAIIKTSDLGDPGDGGIFWIQDSCSVEVS